MAIYLLRVFDYYVVIMVVMIVFYGVMGGSVVIEIEKR